MNKIYQGSALTTKLSSNQVVHFDISRREYSDSHGDPLMRNNIDLLRHRGEGKVMCVCDRTMNKR